jgi:hypothetical protein
MSADVGYSSFGFSLAGSLGLCRQLKNRRLLTDRQSVTGSRRDLRADDVIE